MSYSGTQTPSDEDHSQLFRFYPNCNGEYESIGLPAGGVQQPLMYHVVLTTEPDSDGGVKTYAYKVPETWIDQSLQYFLYPPPGFNVNGSKPWDWGEISYKKRRFTEKSWVEYDVVDVLTETGSVPFTEALTQMEVAQVQVEEDLQQYTRISQIVNLSENEESDSGSSESFKDHSSGRQQKLKLVPQNLNKVRVMNNKVVNFEETILNASSLLEMSPMQPKRSDMDHIQPDAILSALRGIRGEGVTCEAVMKDNMEHFKKVVKSQVSLPILVPEEISVLNAALCDMELSICLCCVQIQNLRTLGSKDKIAKAFLITIFSRSLCSKVQWKKRGKDLRIGIGHLINLVAVFGVGINKVLEMHKQPQLAVSAVVCAVQNARRYHGYEYAKSVTAAACSSTQIDELDDEEECHSRADKEKNMAIDRRMLELNKAILEYNPPKGSYQQK
ncbi:hypothetical protein DAPPUDRAFT_328807 [Daphnia pulex]|uniref:Uncharacterized protein n=1 Tax=Daphnia pulex TaxID=6669 RepID=E9HEU0_DAPPU|nr:hypothetical protein DAPPUDRAFT_328807 [Daphnia pulex]|eukprot:EFX69753.1 hypothetical protein DAPPUDRAFT_328807 [Daphnia pulex]